MGDWLKFLANLIAVVLLVGAITVAFVVFLFS